MPAQVFCSKMDFPVIVVEPQLLVSSHWLARQNETGMSRKLVWLMICFERERERGGGMTMLTPLKFWEVFCEPKTFLDCLNKLGHGFAVIPSLPGTMPAGRVVPEGSTPAFSSGTYSGDIADLPPPPQMLCIQLQRKIVQQFGVQLHRYMLRTSKPVSLFHKFRHGN